MVVLILGYALSKITLVPLQYLFSGSFLICLNDIILGGNWHPDKDLAWLLERHSISWNNPFATKTSIIIHSTISLYTSHFSQNGQKYGKKMKKYENLVRCVLELEKNKWWNYECILMTFYILKTVLTASENRFYF